MLLYIALAFEVFIRFRNFIGGICVLIFFLIHYNKLWLLIYPITFEESMSDSSFYYIDGFKGLIIHQITLNCQGFGHAKYHIDEKYS